MMAGIDMPRIRQRSRLIYTQVQYVVLPWLPRQRSSDARSWPLEDQQLLGLIQVQYMADMKEMQATYWLQKPQGHRVSAWRYPSGSILVHGGSIFIEFTL